MTISGPRLRVLLRQAERAKDAGKLAAAKQSYREVLEEAPDSPDAWLGLADLLTDPQKKEQAYEKVLALDADNQGAKIGLAKLRGTPVPELEEEPEPESELDDAFNQSRDWLAAATAPQTVAEPKKEVETAASASSGQAVSASSGQAASAKPVLSQPKGSGQAISTPITPEPSAPNDEEFELTCYRHPDRSTALRCYSCNRPICSSCTNKTPVGYICLECKYESDEKFFTARKLDYVIAGIVSFVLSLIAGAIVVRLGSGFFLILLVFFVGGAVGGFIGKMTQRVIGGRRGRYMPHLVATMVILGVVIPALPTILGAIAFVAPGVLLKLLVPGIYAFIASSSAFYWMR